MPYLAKFYEYKNIKYARLVYDNNPPLLNEILDHFIIIDSQEDAFKSITSKISNKTSCDAFSAVGLNVHTYDSYRYRYSFATTLSGIVFILSDTTPNDLIETMKEYIKENWTEELCTSFLGNYDYNKQRRLLVKGGYPDKISSWSDLYAIKDKHKYITHDKVDDDSPRHLWDIVSGKIFGENTGSILPVNEDDFLSCLHNNMLCLNCQVDKFECTYKGYKYCCDYNGENVTMYPVIETLDHGIIKALKNNDSIIIHAKIDDVAPYISSVRISFTKDKFIRQKSTAKASLSAITTLKISDSQIVIIDYMTAEMLKIRNRRLGTKVTGDKKFLIDEYKKGLVNLYNANVQKFSSMLPKCGVVTASDLVHSRAINSDMDELEALCFNAYIIKHTAYNALFLNSVENDIYDVEFIIEGLVEGKIPKYKTLIPLEEKI